MQENSIILKKMRWKISVEKRHMFWLRRFQGINNVTFDVMDLGSPLSMVLVWRQILGRPWNAY